MIEAAMNSISAPWWRVLLAQWFGTRFDGHDGINHTVMHRWRGKMYLTDYWPEQPKRAR